MSKIVTGVRLLAGKALEWKKPEKFDVLTHRSINNFSKILLRLKRVSVFVVSVSKIGLKYLCELIVIRLIRNKKKKIEDIKWFKMLKRDFKKLDGYYKREESLKYFVNVIIKRKKYVLKKMFFKGRCFIKYKRKYKLKLNKKTRRFYKYWYIKKFNIKRWWWKRKKFNIKKIKYIKFRKKLIKELRRRLKKFNMLKIIKNTKNKKLFFLNIKNFMLDSMEVKEIFFNIYNKNLKLAGKKVVSRKFFFRAVRKNLKKIASFYVSKHTRSCSEMELQYQKNKQSSKIEKKYKRKKKSRFLYNKKTLTKNKNLLQYVNKKPLKKKLYKLKAAYKLLRNKNKNTIDFFNKIIKDTFLKLKKLYKDRASIYVKLTKNQKRRYRWKFKKKKIYIYLNFSKKAKNKINFSIRKRNRFKKYESLLSVYGVKKFKAKNRREIVGVKSYYYKIILDKLTKMFSLKSNLLAKYSSKSVGSGSVYNKISKNNVLKKKKKVFNIFKMKLKNLIKKYFAVCNFNLVFVYLIRMNNKVKKFVWKAINLFKKKVNKVFKKKSFLLLMYSAILKKPEIFLDYVRKKFRRLLKLYHRKFINKIKKLLWYFPLYFFGLLGMRIYIKGKIAAHLRTRVVDEMVGGINTHNIQNSLFYHKISCTNKYGTFTFKMWYSSNST